jgi:hypothetical protein
MADETRHKRRKVRARWRRLAVGSFAGAALAFYILLVRRLLVEREAAAMSQPGAAQHPENPKTAYEPADWDFAPVALIYVGTLVLLVISCFVLIAAYPDALPDVSRALNSNPPGPRLQTNPEADLRRFRAEENKRLNGYYWVDKQKGLVHIPVEQAMRKLAQTGIPGFPKGQQ